MRFITPILKSLVVPVIWLALTGAIYSRITPFSALNRIFFPSQWGGYTKNKTANQTWRLAQSNRSNCRKINDKVVSCGKFCNFCWQFANSYFFHPKKWMNLISDRFSTASIKYLNWPSPVFGRFQNGCNKVVIEPCGVQFGLCRKMWDKEYYVANSATFVSKSVIFPPKK